MAAENWFRKNPAAVYDIAVDFTNKLDTGRSVSSCTVTAIDLYDNSNATSAVLDDGTAVVASDVCSEGVKAGTSGHEYKLTFLATLDNADKLEEEVFMYVED